VGVVNEYQGKDQGIVERALETIDITARNGRGMINPNWEAQEAKMDAAMARKNGDQPARPKPSATEPDDGEAVSGVVLD
jgi:hypothetical protein